MNPTTEQVRDLMDGDGENRAVRCFLALYGCMQSPNIQDMQQHLAASGFNHCWPAWVNDPANAGHLTKGGAQDWLRHLFALDDALSQQAAEADV